jgi:hypothetical protein
MTQTIEPPVARANAATDAAPQPARPSRAAWWAGWILSGIVILWMGVAGTIFALTQREMVEKNMGDMGYPASAIMPIQAVLILCVILYAIPRTAVLGAVLLTGYLGGAVATHVRIADGMWFFPVIFGVIVWLGLFLRDRRVRDLVPLRKA